MKNDELFPCCHCGKEPQLAKYAIWCPKECDDIIDAYPTKRFGNCSRPSTIKIIKQYLIDEWNKRNEKHNPFRGES